MTQHSTRAASTPPSNSRWGRLLKRPWPAQLVLVAALLLAVPFLFHAGSTVHAADNEITGVTLTSPNPGELVITWDAPSNSPDDYRVTWKKSDGKWTSYKDDNTALGGNAFPTGTSHTVSDLEEGTEYSVRVRARYHDGGGNITESGPWSDPPVETTVSSPPSKDGEGDANEGRSTSLPAKPEDLLAAASHDNVQLIWTDPGDNSITGYQVLRGPGAANLAVLTADTGSTTTSYTDDNVTAETTYIYAVMARNANGLSPQSDPFRVRTPAAPVDPDIALAVAGADFTLDGEMLDTTGTCNVPDIDSVVAACTIDILDAIVPLEIAGTLDATDDVTAAEMPEQSLSERGFVVDLPYGPHEYHQSRVIEEIHGANSHIYRVVVGPDEAGYTSFNVYKKRGHGALGINLFHSDNTCVLYYCDSGVGHDRSIHIYLAEGIYYLEVRHRPVSSGDSMIYGLTWKESLNRGFYEECSQTLSEYSDPMAGCQGHIWQVELDNAWEMQYTGEGIKVAVVDGGVVYMHEDLALAVSLENMEAYDGADGNFNPFDGHGTGMAGIIAARHDDVGTRGIAPDSTIYSLRMRRFLSNDEELQQAMLFRHDEVAVSNNSWGLAWINAPNSKRPVIEQQLLTGISEGYSGKGVSYVFGVSNHQNSNFSDLENYYGSMAVCGVDSNGSFSETSESNPMGYGFNIWVCAPHTTVAATKHNYYRTWAGTSVSTAITSGVVALVRSANTDLTWRDVKLILAESARQNDESNPEWTEGAEKYGSDGRYTYNPNYGFGEVNAYEALKLAVDWENLPPMVEAVHQLPEGGRRRIDDSYPLTKRIVVEDDGETTPAFVEHVEVKLHITHESFRDLDINLVSPAGTISRLSWSDEDAYWREVDEMYSFGSAAHLGENPVGEWRLVITDSMGLVGGRLVDWTLVIRGHKGAGPIALQQQENSPATGTPTISGTVQMGETLTASTSGISDDNGLTNPSYTHQWLSNDGTSDSEIADATASTYTLVAGDVAETIKVRVSFTDDAGYEETSTSEATAAVAPADTGRPYGLAASATMASVTLTWQEPDNFYGPDYHILRHRPEEGEPDPLVYVEFTDTDATTFTDTDVEPGVLYVYQVRATIDFFSTLGEPSNPIEVRVPEKSGSDAPGESNTSATGTPTISGTAQVGETLAADTSGIADSDGLTKVTYSYQWIRNDAGTDTDIQGAAGTTYTLVDADEGKTIKVTVSFADDSGNEETLTSAATASVAARPNSPATGAPTISGTVQVGETLTASTSGIADADGLTNVSHSYQWVANGGTSDSDIADATVSTSTMTVGDTYTVTVDDVGKTIKVNVSFTDDAGNEESLTSSETAEVAATWKATLTVGGSESSEGTVSKGYSSFAGGLGGLAPDYFHIGEEQHSVTVLLYSQTTLSLGMSGNIGTGFVLHLGTNTFDLGDSSTRQGDTAHIYSWSDVDLDWSEADTVVVALVETETEESSGNSPATGAPTISGTAQVGEMLMASTSGIADTDGLTNASYSYQWVRNDGSSDTDIQDATGIQLHPDWRRRGQDHQGEGQLH